MSRSLYARGKEKMPTEKVGIFLEVTPGFELPAPCVIWYILLQNIDNVQ